MKRQDESDSTLDEDSSSNVVDSLDPSEPEAEPSTDTEQPSDSGTSNTTDEQLTIGYLHYHLTQIACPACVGASQEITLTMTMDTHYPTTSSYFESFGLQDTCSTLLYNTSVVSTPLSYGSSINVSAGGNPITLSELSPGVYSSPPLMEYQYTRDTLHSIQFLPSTDTIQDAFMSSHGFDFIEPYTMLWVDPAYAFDAPISRNGATFTWGPSGGSGSFVIQIDVYSWDGSQYLSSVECWGTDNGYLTVPGSYLSTYSPGSLALIHLIRHEIGSFVYPTKGTIETHMQWEVVGTGTIQ